MENNNDFEGIKFTDEEFEKFKEFILSNAPFGEKNCTIFFNRILENTCYYKFTNCLDSMSFNFINILYRAFYNKKNDTLEKPLCTKSNYFANMAYYLGEYYKDKNIDELRSHDFFDDDKRLPFGFPSTLLVSPVIHYGDEVLDLNVGLYDYIKEYIKESPPKIAEDWTNNYGVLLNTLYVNHQSAIDYIGVGTRVLYDQKPMGGRTALFGNELGIELYVMEILNKLEFLVGHSHVFANTEFALSLYEKSSKDNLFEIFSKALSKLNFVKYERKSKSGEEEYYIRPLKDGNGNIFAFYTLTFNQSVFDNRYSVTPYIIMSDFKYENGSMPLFDNYKKEYSNTSFLNQNKAEALYLILNYNLLKLVESECGKKIVTNDRLDIDKIRLGFKNMFASSSEDLVSELIKYEKPIWTLDQMDKFILNATKNSTPLYSNLSSSNKHQTKDFSVELENVFIRELSKNRFRILEESRIYQVSYCRNKTYPINQLFDESRQFGVNDEIDAINLIGEFLRLTYEGVIDTKLDRDKDTYQYTYHAG